jgi:raffinose/stachyose/melibiose transport system permease protein
MNQTRRIRPLALWMFLLPGLLIYCFIIAFPILFSVFLSFFSFVTIGNLKYTALDNFRRLVADQDFLNALRNNVVIIFGSIVGQLGIGYLFALYFSGRTRKFGNALQAAIFFPAALSPVVIGFVWKIIYARHYGPINTLLGLFIADSRLPAWLENPDIALFSVLVPIIWQQVGFYMVVFIAGIRAIPTEILEVAEIDGAGWWARIRHIIVPLTRGTWRTCFVLCIAGSMRIFDQVYVMTAGGPGRSTQVLALLTYQTSFSYMRLGYGNAMSVGITVLGILFVVISQVLTARPGKGGEPA